MHDVFGVVVFNYAFSMPKRMKRNFINPWGAQLFSYSSTLNS
jgi:hypothetical protein